MLGALVLALFLLASWERHGLEMEMKMKEIKQVEEVNEGFFYVYGAPCFGFAERKKKGRECNINKRSTGNLGYKAYLVVFAYLVCCLTFKYAWLVGRAGA